MAAPVFPSRRTVATMHMDTMGITRRGFVSIAEALPCSKEPRSVTTNDNIDGAGVAVDMHVGKGSGKKLAMSASGPMSETGWM